MEKGFHPLKINYDILGNTDAFLHAHIFPRYEWEELQNRTKPIWLYPATNWSDPKYQYTQEKYEEKRLLLQTKLKELIEAYYAE